jgi:hypothetical protein
MPEKDVVETRLDRLLRESEALRETSAGLAEDVQRLKAEIRTGQLKRRRKRVRAKGT